MRKSKTYSELTIFIHSFDAKKVDTAVKALKSAMIVLEDIKDIDVSLEEDVGITNSVFCTGCGGIVYDYSHHCPECKSLV